MATERGTRPVPGRLIACWTVPNRHRVAVVLAAVLVTAASTGCMSRSSGLASSCTLSAVPGSTASSDVPSGVARIGDRVLSVGTRFQGSAGSPLAAFGDRASWSAAMIPAYPGRIVELDDVTASIGDAWAVGAITNVAPAVTSWDGQRWTAMRIADPGPGEDGLTGVAAVSQTSVWAVGRHQRGIAFATLVERWDGRTWRIVASPNIARSSNVLKDVAAPGPNDAWAVGWVVQHERYRTLVEHWDGARWTIVSTPDGGGVDALFTGVAAVNANDVWAVGRTADGDVQHPLVEHWDGHAWNLVQLPPAVDLAALGGVTATPTGVAIVGRLLDGTQPRPLVLILAGKVWTVASFDAGNGPSWLAGVTVDADGTVFAVGSSAPGNSITASLAVTDCAP